ncbi:MAG: acetyl-CoA carboxylase carboxyltransferase subunit alpha [Spirochaetales bacterium]|nr:acetyl-CoA carboxylase carboxyltransferase subunit alpha [Spirochaetales bacterium]
MEELKNKLEELKALAGKENLDISKNLEEIEAMLNVGKDSPTWEKVQLARRLDRPGALEFINLICDDFMELHGDRYFKDDPALIGGIGTIDGQPITFIGNQKGSNLKENLHRNYGMGSPEGYRKALRLVKQAEKFNRPVVSFIDTSGAYPGPEAEARGVGEAIARNLKEFSLLKVPIICFVIGEGGSGGAIGIGVGDKLYMLENAIYSVISPEGFASILLRDSNKAKEAADIMKMTAKDLFEFGIIHGIIPEAPGGVQNNPTYTAEMIKELIMTNIGVLSKKKPESLIRYRSRKIREIGQFTETAGKEQDLFGLFSRLFN